MKGKRRSQLHAHIPGTPDDTSQVAHLAGIADDVDVLGFFGQRRGTVTGGEDHRVGIDLILHAVFVGHDDAVFLENVPDSVVLKSKKSDKWVSFDYKGMQYLGIWHTPKTEAPFVCIEPWMGCPDYDSRITELTEKRDMVMLSAGVENEHVLKFTVN